MIHKEISDVQCNIIVKHLPESAKTRRPRCDDRTTINGILCVLTTVVDVQTYQTNTVQNLLHILDSKSYNKKECGKRSYQN